MADPSSIEPQPVRAASNPSAGPVAAKAPRRRKRRSVLLLVVAGILWAVGQGLGWFGAGPSGEKGEGGGEARGAAPATLAGSGLPGNGGADLHRAEPNEGGRASLDGNADGGAKHGAGVPVAIGTKEPDDQPSVAVVEQGAPAVAPTVANESNPDPDPELNEVVSSDRFVSLLSLLESHLRDKQLGHASAALQRMYDRPLSEKQREQVAAFAKRLEPLQKACEARVLALVEGGEVLAANREAAQLVVAGTWHATGLHDAAPALQLASNWQGAVDVEPQSVPAPTPLLRNRQVRVVFRDEVRTGVVASSNRDEVTVRLVSSRGQTFPTVKAIACEPSESTSSEAVEMGLAAVRSGAPRLARLWMLRAHLLKDELTTRGQQLLKLLQ